MQFNLTRFGKAVTQFPLPKKIFKRDIQARIRAATKVETGVGYVVQRGEHEWDPDGEDMVLRHTLMHALCVIAKDFATEALEFGEENNDFSFLLRLNCGIDGGVYWRVRLDSEAHVAEVLSTYTFMQWDDVRMVAAWSGTSDETRAFVSAILNKFEELRSQGRYHIPWEYPSWSSHGKEEDVDRVARVRDGHILRRHGMLPGVDFCDWVDLLRPGDSFEKDGLRFVISSVVAPDVDPHSKTRRYFAEVTSTDGHSVMLCQALKDPSWEYVLPPEIAAMVPPPAGKAAAASSLAHPKNDATVLTRMTVSPFVEVRIRPEGSEVRTDIRVEERVSLKILVHDPTPSAVVYYDPVDPQVWILA
jgi:hypothetical protein